VTADGRRKSSLIIGGQQVGRTKCIIARDGLEILDHEDRRRAGCHTPDENAAHLRAAAAGNAKSTHHFDIHPGNYGSAEADRNGSVGCGPVDVLVCVCFGHLP
jgi:hypothetical protein